MKSLVQSKSGRVGVELSPSRPAAPSDTPAAPHPSTPPQPAPTQLLHQIIALISHHQTQSNHDCHCGRNRSCHPLAAFPPLPRGSTPPTTTSPGVNSADTNSPNIDALLSGVVTLLQQELGFDRCSFLWCLQDSNSASPSVPSLYITHEAKVESLSTHVGELSPAQAQILYPLVCCSEIQTLDFAQDPSGADANLATPYGTFLADAPISQVLAPQETNSSAYPSLGEVFKDWPLQWLVIVPLTTHAGQPGALLCGGHQPNAHRQNPLVLETLSAVGSLLTLAIQKADCQAQNRAIHLAAQTQKKYLQEALQNLQQAQLQLIQSEKMSSLGQLVAGVAHEINNPVNFITGNIQYAEQYAADLLGLVNLYEKYYPQPHPEVETYRTTIDLNFLREDQDKIFRSMVMGTDRIKQIVNSLRNFSRLDESEVKAVNVHDGLESTLLILENRTKASPQGGGITIDRRYGDLPLIECFAGQLNQVFMNLLSNAIDALMAQPHNPTIIITTTAFCIFPQSATADRIRITIADNGPGMTRATQERIFNPFFTTKPPGAGTGLGLSISYKIVTDRHRGTLSCQSVLNQGTAFIVEIPVRLQTPAP